MEKPVWVRVLLQLVVPMVMVVALFILDYIYTYVWYATTSGPDTFKVDGPNIIFDVAALLGAGALAAGLSSRLVRRPWDGLAGVALLVGAWGIVGWIHPCGGLDAGGEIRVVAFMTAPVVGCALTAWVLERRRHLPLGTNRGQ